jgi:hypothetical protein
MASQNRAASLQLVDPVLTNVARRYKSDGFIYNQIVANQPVSTLTGKYPVFTKQDWFSNDIDNKTSDRAPAKEISFTHDTENFSCDEYSYKVSITDLERQQADSALHLESSLTDYLMLHQSLAREVRLANLLRKTTNSGSLNLGAAPSNNWDVDAATIEADIKTAQLAIYDATGLTANTIVMPYKVAYAVAVQQDIREIMKYTVNGQDVLRLGDAVLPPVLHGLRVVIPMGPQVTTDAEGAASPTYSEVWGDHVRVLYVNQGARWGTPSCVYRFNHTSDTVTRWRENDPDVEYIRVKERCDEKVVAPDMGYEIASVLS